MHYLSFALGENTEGVTTLTLAGSAAFVDTVLARFGEATS